MESQDNHFENDQRSNPDRRKFNDPNYKGPERRSGLDRRSDEKTPLPTDVQAEDDDME